MRFHRVFCAFDHSSSARTALSLATSFARPGGLLLICRVVERDRVLADIGDVEAAEQIAADALAASDQTLEALRREMAAQVAGAEAWTVEGDSAWSGLTTEAERWHADLIVIGRGSRPHGMLGSTAERVVRHAACAVLVAGHEARPIGRILCAVDFSPSSRQALATAAALAGERGAELGLVHVVSNRDRALFAEAAALAGAADARRTAERTLGGWVDELDRAVRSRTVISVVEGRPADAIKDCARAGWYDLIVTGSHGRTGIPRVLLGSVAEEIVRSADRPVLVVR